MDAVLDTALGAVPALAMFVVVLGIVVGMRGLFSMGLMNGLVALMFIMVVLMMVVIRVGLSGDIRGEGAGRLRKHRCRKHVPGDRLMRIMIVLVIIVLVIERLIARRLVIVVIMQVVIMQVVLGVMVIAGMLLAGRIMSVSGAVPGLLVFGVAVVGDVAFDACRVRGIGLGVLDDLALNTLAAAAPARVAMTRAPAAGPVLALLFGLAMGTFVGLDQRLTVGDRDLIIIG